MKLACLMFVLSAHSCEPFLKAAFLHNLGEDSGGGEEDELLEVRVPALCHSQLTGIEINLPPGATLMIFRRRNRW